MELFRQLPLGSQDVPWLPFPDEQKGSFPALADRFAVLDAEVLPAFLEQDSGALKAQIRYRRFRLALMLGAALTTVFGAVLAAVGDATWPGLAVAVVGLATSGIANQYRRDQPLARYLTSRTKAEQLRSIYFRYLSGLDGDDRRALEKRVVAIAHAKPTEVSNG